MRGNFYELNINSPAYFTDHYGIDEEVYKYCQQLHDFFRTREYSESMNIIGITPVIAPKEIYDQGMWKEKVQVVGLGSCAIIDIRMDFDNYYNADSNGKIELIQQMIIRAVRKIKSKGKFDWEKFRDDLLKYQG